MLLERHPTTRPRSKTIGTKITGHAKITIIIIASPMLTSAKVAGHEATECITEMHAPLLAKLASIVTRQATSYVYAGNHQGNVIA